MSEQITLAARIKELIQQHGTLRAAGRAIQVDCSYLSRMEKGEKFNPSETILRRMGLREVTVYERAALSTPPARIEPVGEAEIVGDTRFEGWLSCHEPDRRDGRSPRYTKHDMQESYWAGYQERASLAAPASAGVEEFPLPDSQAARDVLAERKRQIEKEGWTPEHDDEHDDGVMALAAAGYAHAAFWNAFKPDEAFTADDPPRGWPEEWDFKPAEPRRMLVKAGALILAEIERLDRSASLGLQARTEGKV